MTVTKEAQELLEPRMRRLQLAEMATLYFSLGDRVKLHLKQNKTKKPIKMKQQQQKQLNKAQQMLKLRY